MFAALNKPDRRSLLLNLFVAVMSVLLVNGLIFALGWGKANVSPNAPPDYVIGSVWIVLFIFMAIARWQLNAYALGQEWSARTWISILMVFCLLYPFYALAINSQINGLLGNLGTILLTLFVLVKVGQISKLAALLVFPIIPWVTFATVAILRNSG